MIVFKRFSLLISLFLCFSFYVKASTKEEADLFLDFARSFSPPISHDVGGANNFDGIQELLNIAGPDLLNGSSISIHAVSSFHEAQPHIDALKAGDIWLSDVDQTLVDNNFELMEAGIVERLERAKERKVSVLALTAAKHPNQRKESFLMRKNIRFSMKFSHLSNCERLSTLDQGILCSKGEKKDVTVKRFLKSAFPIQETELRKGKKVF
ncbi:MAG: hypothetical protein K2Q34_05015 [Alphaproteobacteria bacterium]|nr:hypothetical protein [Alphaproteobacteria bacterium]